MEALVPGSIVLYYRQNALRFGAVLDSEDCQARVLEHPEGIQRLAGPRILIVSHVPVAQDIPTSLSDFRSAALELSASLNPQDLLSAWAGLSDPFDFDAACGALGFQADRERFAVYAFIDSHPELLQRKGGYLSLRDEAGRFAYLEEKQVAAERRAFLTRVEAYLIPNAEKPRAELSSTDRESLLAELREIAAAGGGKDLIRVLHKAYSESPLLKTVRQLRLDLGDLLPDTDPVAAGSGIPVCFTPGLESQTRTFKPRLAHDCEVFTIDAEDSEDLDDALSLEALPEGWRLGVHISDVASRIPSDSALFATAGERVASLYLPGDTIPLLPEVLSHHEFSLREGQVRPVLTLWASFDRNWSLRGYEFRRAVVLIRRNLSYEYVDSCLAEDPYARLLQLCQKLQFDRLGERQENRSRYTWIVKAAKGEVSLARLDNHSPARFIIEELMILYNRLVAEEARSAGLPLIYRNIQQFTEDLDEETGLPYGIQAYLSTEPQYHPGIGSQAYLHASSPIRRFTDILNQTQFLSHLDGDQTPFSRDELDYLIPCIEKRLLKIKEISQRSERYWLLRYLKERHLEEPLDAVLLRKLRHGYLAELSRWEKRIVLRCKDRLPMQEPIKLVISGIDLEELFVQGDVIN